MGLHRRCIFMFLASILLLHTGCSTPDISGTISKDAADRQLAEEIDPSCSYFYFLWARYTELYLQFDEALAAYRKALICDPGNPFIQRKIPVILLRMERDDEAVTWLKNHLVHTPDDTAMRELLAKAYLRQNNFDQAISEYQYLIQQLPGNPIPRYLLAELFFQKGIRACTAYSFAGVNHGQWCTPWAPAACSYLQASTQSYKSNISSSTSAA